MSVTAVAIAVGVSATVVDAMPFSSVGAMAVVSADTADRPLMATTMIRWGTAMVVVAPLAAWALFVLPTA